MLYSLLSLIVLNRLAYGVDVTDCPFGFVVLEGQCACPMGLKASGSVCVQDCDPETDVECFGTELMNVRRRWSLGSMLEDLFGSQPSGSGTSWVNDAGNEIEGTTNAVKAIYGMAAYGGENFIKDVNGYLQPTIDFVEGLISGSLDILTKVQTCAKNTASILGSMSRAADFEALVKYAAEHDNFEDNNWNLYATWLAIDNMKGSIDKCKSSCSFMGEAASKFEDMIEMMVILMEGGETINGMNLGGSGLYGWRRRLEAMSGYNDLGDGQFTVRVSTNDIERMAGRLIADHPESKTWSPMRRQELLEENMQLIRNMMRMMPETDDEEEHLVAPTMKEERRRIDSDDFATKFFFGYGFTLMGAGMMVDFAVAVNDGYPNSMGGFMTRCEGFNLDFASAGFEMGVLFMDTDDIEGASEAIAFGADFPGLEFGCAINLIKIGSKVVGGGYSCGGGAGIIPLTFTWMDCQTNAMWN